MNDKYIFYGSIPKGYNFKGVMDSMSIPIKRGRFIITKDGIKHCDEPDEEEKIQQTILYTFDFPRTSFSSFVCPNPFIFKCSLIHLTKLLKSVKKKDFLTIEILKDNPTSMNLIIGSSTTQGIGLKETHSLKIQESIDNGKTDPPPDEIFNGSLNISAYYNPITVKNVDFLKTKKIHTLGGKIVAMKMQRDNYLFMGAGVGELYTSKIEFGELLAENNLPPDPDVVGIDGANSDHTYNASYGVSIISMLVKLMSLCKIAHFYQPKLSCYPLKVCVDIPELGKVVIYVFSNEQIDRSIAEKAS